jgi:serine protease
MAPGGDLSRDQNGDGYADGILQETIEGGQWTYTFWEGTSMATPHVAAAAALVLAQGDYSPAEVYEILASTARDIGSGGYDTQTGHGLINIEAAVARASGGSPEEPVEEVPEEEEAPASPDIQDLNISGVTGWTDGNSFTIQWTTNNAANSYVEFEQYGVYGDELLTTSHTLRFSAEEGMSFDFNILSTDADGSTAEDGPWTIRL